MATILASLSTSEIVDGEEETDIDGRVLQIYLDTQHNPCRVLVLGMLLHVSSLDDGLDLITLVLPAEESPVARQMFRDQHALLEQLMDDGDSSVIRAVVSKQLWSQGSPDLPGIIIYVRVSRGTVLDVSDLSAVDASHEFAAFRPEVPAVRGSTGVLVKGALLACEVDMFRVDIPLFSPAGLPQAIFTRTYGLNAAKAVRFVK
ncbi:hypothetical protein DFH06DRAFT_1151648 [Mycena polygramma]|nr:hypothetical protein DFH06DRAFT_1151648 [Mycena polygramma]